jgi:hypothetical protein
MVTLQVIPVPAIAPLCPGDTVAPRGFGGVEATVVEVVPSSVPNGETKYLVQWHEPTALDGQPRQARLFREDLFLVKLAGE